MGRETATAVLGGGRVGFGHRSDPPFYPPSQSASLQLQLFCFPSLPFPSLASSIPPLIHHPKIRILQGLSLALFLAYHHHPTSFFLLPPPMANFLRRLVRSKSRSKSPQKGQQCPPIVTEDNEWREEGTQRVPKMGSNHIGTAHRRGRHLPNDVAAGSKKLINHIPPPSPSVHHKHPSPYLDCPPQSSPKLDRRRFHPTANDTEPGTSSQEFLSPTLWPSSPVPTSWSMRNSHSNPDSAADSQRPPTHTKAVKEYEAEINETVPSSSSALPLSPHQQRHRSSSPRKPGGSNKSVAGRATADSSDKRRNFHSRSPAKKSPSSGSRAQSTAMSKTMDYLQAQCRMEGCSATILVEDTRFLVCKHQLSHASDFFRSLFLNSRALPLEGVRHIQADEYVVQVSSLRHPPQALQFQWFLETTVPSPMLRDVSDELLETCMRLCKRFAARGLEMRCTRFIQDNVEAKPPMMALCWLNWTFKHRFHRSVQDACLPVVGRLSLQMLEKHRQMVPEAVFADLLAMKLRTAYQQASTVFHTIHRMDHFHVEMEKCPRCGRQREQGRVRIQASPCHKLIGCERCMREFVCELENLAVPSPAVGGNPEMQAYWQCDHGLWAFSERTEDCRCQTQLYRANRMLGGGADRERETLEGIGGGASRQTASNLTLASKPSSSAASRS